MTTEIPATPIEQGKPNLLIFMVDQLTGTLFLMVLSTGCTHPT
jgi:hypothetical protein